MFIYHIANISPYNTKASSKHGQAWYAGGKNDIVYRCSLSPLFIYIVASSPRESGRQPATLFSEFVSKTLLLQCLLDLN